MSTIVLAISAAVQLTIFLSASTLLPPKFTVLQLFTHCSTPTRDLRDRFMFASIWHVEPHQVAPKRRSPKVRLLRLVSALASERHQCSSLKLELLFAKKFLHLRRNHKLQNSSPENQHPPNKKFRMRHRKRQISHWCFFHESAIPTHSASTTTSQATAIRPCEKLLQLAPACPAALRWWTSPTSMPSAPAADRPRPPAADGTGRG